MQSIWILCIYRDSAQFVCNTYTLHQVIKIIECDTPKFRRDSELKIPRSTFGCQAVRLKLVHIKLRLSLDQLQSNLTAVPLSSHVQCWCW